MADGTKQDQRSNRSRTTTTNNTINALLALNCRDTFIDLAQETNMPSVTSNMSAHGESVEQQFENIVHNGGSADELSRVSGNLARKMQNNADNLLQFIVGNRHGPAYLQCFNHCVGGPQDIRKFLQNFANSAGFGHVNDYLNFQRPGLSITQKLGFGNERDTAGASEVGKRIRNALRATAQAPAGAGK